MVLILQVWLNLRNKYENFRNLEEQSERPKHSCLFGVYTSITTTSQMTQIVLGFSTQLCKENKFLLMKFTSLFCTSADPSVTDFLLTHPVFMPYSQLCAALQHQYPATKGLIFHFILIFLSVFFVLLLVFRPKSSK